jgi:hypothetical protein
MNKTNIRRLQNGIDVWTTSLNAVDISSAYSYNEQAGLILKDPRRYTSSEFTGLIADPETSEQLDDMYTDIRKLVKKTEMERLRRDALNRPNGTFLSDHGAIGATLQPHLMEQIPGLLEMFDGEAASDTNTSMPEEVAGKLKERKSRGAIMKQFLEHLMKTQTSQDSELKGKNKDLQDANTIIKRLESPKSQTNNQQDIENLEKMTELFKKFDVRTIIRDPVQNTHMADVDAVNRQYRLSNDLIVKELKVLNSKLTNNQGGNLDELLNAIKSLADNKNHVNQDFINRMGEINVYRAELSSFVSVIDTMRRDVNSTLEQQSAAQIHQLEKYRKDDLSRNNANVEQINKRHTNELAGIRAELKNNISENTENMNRLKGRMQTDSVMAQNHETELRKALDVMGRDATKAKSSVDSLNERIQQLDINTSVLANQLRESQQQYVQSRGQDTNLARQVEQMTEQQTEMMRSNNLLLKQLVQAEQKHANLKTLKSKTENLSSIIPTVQTGIQNRQDNNDQRLRRKASKTKRSQPLPYARVRPQSDKNTFSQFADGPDVSDDEEMGNIRPDVSDDEDMGIIRPDDNQVSKTNVSRRRDRKRTAPYDKKSRVRNDRASQVQPEMRDVDKNERDFKNTLAFVANFDPNNPNVVADYMVGDESEEDFEFINDWNQSYDQSVFSKIEPMVPQNNPSRFFIQEPKKSGNDNQDQLPVEVKQKLIKHMATADINELQNLTDQGMLIGGYTVPSNIINQYIMARTRNILEEKGLINKQKQDAGSNSKVDIEILPDDDTVSPSTASIPASQPLNPTPNQRKVAKSIPDKQSNSSKSIERQKTARDIARGNRQVNKMQKLITSSDVNGTDDALSPASQPLTVSDTQPRQNQDAPISIIQLVLGAGHALFNPANEDQNLVRLMQQEAQREKTRRETQAKDTQQRQIQDAPQTLIGSVVGAIWKRTPLNKETERKTNVSLYMKEAAQMQNQRTLKPVTDGRGNRIKREADRAKASRKATLQKKRKANLQKKRDEDIRNVANIDVTVDPNPSSTPLTSSDVKPDDQINMDTEVKIESKDPTGKRKKPGLAEQPDLLRKKKKKKGRKKKRRKQRAIQRMSNEAEKEGTKDSLDASSLPLSKPPTPSESESAPMSLTQFVRSVPRRGSGVPSQGSVWTSWQAAPLIDPLKNSLLEVDDDSTRKSRGRNK